MSESFESFWARVESHVDSPKESAHYAWDVQQQRLNVCNDLIAMYQGGYKGGCYACETVGEKNVEMQARIAELEQQLKASELMSQHRASTFHQAGM